MFELLVGLAAILAILLIAAVFYALTYRAERRVTPPEAMRTQHPRGPRMASF